MGWLEKRRTARWIAHNEVLAGWLEDVDSYRGGTSSRDMSLGRGERIYYNYAGASLVEIKRGQGHYEGSSSGISVPLPLGLRAYGGSSRGRYVPGEEKPTKLDDGTCYITNQRVTFAGTRQVREWRLDRILAAAPGSGAGWGHSAFYISVSNRQKVSAVGVSRRVEPELGFMLALVLARHRRQEPRLRSELEELVRQHRAAAPPKLLQALGACEALPSGRVPDGPAQITGGGPSGGRLRVRTKQDEVIEDPSEDHLFLLVDDLRRNQDFFIVEKLADPTGQTYAQVMREGDGYLIERRDGSAGTHQHATTGDPRKVQHDLTTWAFALARADGLRWATGYAP